MDEGVAVGVEGVPSEAEFVQLYCRSTCSSSCPDTFIEASFLIRESAGRRREGGAAAGVRAALDVPQGVHPLSEGRDRARRVLARPGGQRELDERNRERGDESVSLDGNVPGWAEAGRLGARRREVVTGLRAHSMRRFYPPPSLCIYGRRPGAAALAAGKRKGTECTSCLRTVWSPGSSAETSSLLLRDHLRRVIVPSKPFPAYPAAFNVLVADVVASKLLLPAEVLPPDPILVSSLCTGGKREKR